MASIITCPNAPVFFWVYRSLVLNQMVLTHSVGSNCEEDQYELLYNLRQFIIDNSASEASSESASVTCSVSSVTFQSPPESISNASAFAKRLSTYYTAGYVLLNMGSTDCIECGEKCLTNSPDGSHGMIRLRDRVSGFRLVYPSHTFSKFYEHTLKLILENLPSVCLQKGFDTYLTDLLVQRLHFDSIICIQHLESFRKNYCAFVIKFTVHAWCKRVNQYLCGKDTRLFLGLDPILRAAAEYFRKKKKQP